MSDDDTLLVDSFGHNHVQKSHKDWADYWSYINYVALNPPRTFQSNFLNLLQEYFGAHTQIHAHLEGVDKRFQRIQQLHKGAMTKEEMKSGAKGRLDDQVQPTGKQPKLNRIQ